MPSEATIAARDFRPGSAFECLNLSLKLAQRFQRCDQKRNECGLQPRGTQPFTLSS